MTHILRTGVQSALRALCTLFSPDLDDSSVALTLQAHLHCLGENRKGHLCGGEVATQAGDPICQEFEIFVLEPDAKSGSKVFLPGLGG